MAMVFSYVLHIKECLVIPEYSFAVMIDNTILNLSHKEFEIL